MKNWTKLLTILVFALTTPILFADHHRSNDSAHEKCCEHKDCCKDKECKENCKSGKCKKGQCDMKNSEEKKPEAPKKTEK